MMAKKSLVARMRGDANLAGDWAAKYLTLYQTMFD
jgi:hypothetical protein